MKILVIEDNPADILIIRKYLGPFVDLIIENSAHNLPHKVFDVDMVLLDLNLSSTSGKEILVRLKQERKGVPVIIFSNSRSPEDIKFCYQHGAACYIIKPFTLKNTVEVLMNLVRFWNLVRFEETNDQ